GLSPCRIYLPLTGCSSSLGSVSSADLGIQIGGVVLVGFLFALVGVLGVVRVFDNLDGKRQKTSAIIISGTCFAVTLFLHGWAFSGHPFGVLGQGGTSKR